MAFPTGVTMNTAATPMCLCVSRQERDTLCMKLNKGQHPNERSQGVAGSHPVARLVHQLPSASESISSLIRCSGPLPRKGRGTRPVEWRRPQLRNHHVCALRSAVSRFRMLVPSRGHHDARFFSFNIICTILGGMPKGTSLLRSCPLLSSIKPVQKYTR
jgi:hypothetical protein